MYKLLEVDCNQTKSTPKKLFKMCDFWMYSVNLGVLIRQGDKQNSRYVASESTKAKLDYSVTPGIRRLKTIVIKGHLPSISALKFKDDIPYFP